VSDKEGESERVSDKEGESERVSDKEGESERVSDKEGSLSENETRGISIVTPPFPGAP